jgi:hypothetical protein
MKYAAGYGIAVGFLIIGQWIFFIVMGAVPELQYAPWSIGFHIAAELALALTLITGGVAALRDQKWGDPILLVALGMAIYSEINSPGYFAQQGTWALVGMFAVLLAGAIIAVQQLNIRFKE